MSDRFIGFRYELHPTAIEGDDLKAAIRGEAMLQWLSHNTFLSFTNFMSSKPMNLKTRQMTCSASDGLKTVPSTKQLSVRFDAKNPQDTK